MQVESLKSWQSVIEKMAWFLLLLGIGFWVSRFPAQQICLLAGGGLLASWLLLRGILFRSESRTKQFSTRGAFLGSGLLVGAVVSKFLYWETTGVLWLGGKLLTSIALLFYWLKFLQWPLRERSYQYAIVLLVVALPLEQVTLSQLFAFQHHDEPELVRRFERMQQHPKNEAYRQSFERYQEARKQRKRFLNPPE